MADQEARFNAYARPTPQGLSIDTEGMMVDLITFLKVGGMTKTEFLLEADHMWDEVEVELYIPNASKN